jgi:hypothetical protein
MRLAIEFVSIYGLYALTAAILIWRFGLRDRVPFIIVAWLMPPMLVASILHFTLRVIFGKRPRVRPCPIGLDEAEGLVERKRLEMFGGKSIQPHFATDWALLYQATLELEAQAVQTIARRVLAWA